MTVVGGVGDYRGIDRKYCSATASVIVGLDPTIHTVISKIAQKFICGM